MNQLALFTIEEPESERVMSLREFNTKKKLDERLKFSNWLYVGPASSQKFGFPESPLNKKRKQSRAEYKRWLWQELNVLANTGEHTSAVADLPLLPADTVFVCSCAGSLKSCHAHVLVDALDFLQHAELDMESEVLVRKY